MKQIRVLLTCISLSGAALAVYGCGGGGGGGAASVTSDPLTSARAALNGMASGSQTTTTQSLNSALTLFQQALKADPTDPTARFGEAVALAGVCTDLMDGGTTTVPPPGGGIGSGSGSGSSGSGVATPLATKSAHNAAPTRAGGGQYAGPNIPAPPATGTVPPVPPNVTSTPPPASPDNTLGLIWFLDRGLSNPYTLLEELGPVTDLHLGLMPFSGYASDGSDVARREKLLTDLGTILSDLAVVEADSSFTYTLPALSDQNGGGTRLRLVFLKCICLMPT